MMIYMQVDDVREISTEYLPFQNDRGIPQVDKRPSHLWIIILVFKI